MKRTGRAAQSEFVNFEAGMMPMLLPPLMMIVVVVVSVAVTHTAPQWIDAHESSPTDEDKLESASER